jgi:hypothetical protein
MTINIIGFTPTEIIFASDEKRYYPKKDVVEKTLSGEIQIDHKNLREYIAEIETDVPKIRQLGKSTALIYGGTGDFLDVIEGLNEHENISDQITERLKCKEKITAYWNCHVAQLGKLTTIIYKNGEIETKEQVTENIWLSSFVPEVKDIFFKRYITAFYLGDTEEKTAVLQEFFKEITELFHGDVGGLPVIARISKDGFEWIVKPKVLPFACFTGYSNNWCPEKLETMSTTSLSWSSTDWTNVLDLQFECESTMLIVAFAFMDTEMYRASAGSLFGFVKLTLDDVDLPATQAVLYEDGGNGLTAFEVPVHIHTVFTALKGVHHLKIAMRVYSSSYTIWGYSRRLSILKGFYQGGTT